MNGAVRKQALETAGLVHPRTEAVSAELFDGSRAFFLADDKVQVKYEMLRVRAVDGVSVTSAAAAHGYSRAAFYLVASAFERSGMSGLFDDRRGRKGPLKLKPEIVAFILAADSRWSGAELSEIIGTRFGVSLHRRTIERVRVR
jgi:transposase